MIDRAKPLHIVLQFAPFDAYAAGTKDREYRCVGTRFNSRTCFVGRSVVLMRGRSKRDTLSARIIAYTELAESPPWLRARYPLGMRVCEIFMKISSNYEMIHEHTDS